MPELALKRNLRKDEKELAELVLTPTFAPISRSRAAVARRAHNPKVGGSNPPFATKTLSLLIEAFFMFTVYVLYSKSFDKIYIGFTSNIAERFKSHKS